MLPSLVSVVHASGTLVLKVGKDLVAESPLGFKRTLYVALLIGQAMHVKCKLLTADYY